MKTTPYEKVIFVSKPRCASTSTFEYIYSWDDETMGSKPFYHATAKAMRIIMTDWSVKPKFAIVRDPVSLVVSWYQHHKFGRPSKTTSTYYPNDINEWIASGFKTHWNHWSHQTKSTNPLVQNNWTHHGGKQLVDFIIKLEDQEWGPFEEASGLDMSNLPKLNPSPEIKEGFLSDKSLEMIYDYFEEDFLIYGYDMRNKDS